MIPVITSPNFNTILNGFFWDNFVQVTNTYKVDNHITQLLAQFWNGFEWENTNRYIYTYEGNLQTKLFQSWNGSTWLKSRLERQTYDENNFLPGYFNLAITIIQVMWSYKAIVPIISSKPLLVLKI
jgi:hypothetical protein